MASTAAPPPMAEPAPPPEPSPAPLPPPPQASRGAGAVRRDFDGIIATPGRRPEQPGAIAGSRLPRFQCSPPRPSARYTLDRALIGAPPSLGGVATRLTAALDRLGYVDYSFYQTCGGFAVVTRVEQTRPDGEPLPANARWRPPSEGAADGAFTLSAYLRALLGAPPGHYRVIVLRVSGEIMVPAERGLTARAADSLLASGADRLDAPVARLAYTSGHAVSVLVYEYRKRGARSAAVQVFPGGAPSQAARERVRAALAQR